MNNIRCPNCNRSVQADKHFCPHCGKPLHAHSGDAATTLLAAPPNPGASTQPRPTARLDNVLPFDGLPTRAILQDRYLVHGEAGPREPDLAHYHAEDIVGMHLCPGCARLAALNEQFCGNCGIDLQTQPPYYPRYLLKESPRAERLAAERTLAAGPLLGESVLLPQVAFEQTFGGATHYYVLQFRPGQTPDALPHPPEAGHVLAWGAQLARGLQALHDRQIALSTLTPSHLLVDGERAWLADFSNAVLNAGPAQMQANVAQLVQRLHNLLIAGGAALPPTLQMLFGGWLNGRAPVSGKALATELNAAAELLRRPLNLTLRVGKRTDVGIVRTLNEDSLLTLELTQSNQGRSESSGLLVVADGMGGHEGGEIASGMTVEMLRRQALSELFGATDNPPPAGDWLRATIDRANRAIYDEAKRRRSDMGTTVVAVLISGQRATVAHAGDSRAYLITPQAITQITTDHSLVERLVATGQITRAEARNHPQSNIVYKTLGDKPKVEADVSEHTLQPGATLLLCSDGLSGMLEDAEIHQIVTRAADLQLACDELIRAANRAGGEDNITALLLRLDAS